MLNTLTTDLKYAVRMILKTPVVTVIAVTSLAVGVAANAAIFSLMNSWLLRPLPYPDADRMVMVYENNRNTPDDTENVSAANFFDWQEQSSSFGPWIASTFSNRSLTGIDRPEQMTVAQVTPNFFAALRSDPMLGRTFAPDEGGPEDPPVAVLGETTWRNQFGADADLLGKTIMLNSEAYTVVGVMPETFDYLLGTVDLWIPSTFEHRRDDRQSRFLTVTTWHREGISFERAQAELVAIATRLEEQYPDANEDWGVNVQTVREQFPGRTDTGLIMLLMAVVGLALLIACANVASLLLAKTEARQRELAVRAALGAGKSRIVRQLLTESVVLALVAGALGMTLSVWGVRGLATAIPDILPQFFLPRIDGQVVAFTVTLSVLAGITFGIAPATQAVSGDLRGALTDGRSRTVSRTRKRLRGAFVMAEFAMALTILIAAATLTSLFRTSLSVEPGYNAEHLLTMQLALPEYKYEDAEAITRFVDDVRRELQQLSGVRNVAFANQFPRTWGLPGGAFTIDGQAVGQNEEPRASWLSINPDYLTTLEITLRSGRDFTTADRRDAPPVVLVNQRLVDMFFDGTDALGRHITMQGASREIVGVVSDVMQARLNPIEPIAATVYFPMAQRPVRSIGLMIRTPNDPYQVAAPAQRAIWSVDPDQPVFAVQTLEEYIDTQLAGPAMLGELLYLVGLLALALAAMGIYGVMAYSVTQQTNEIGIRMALGAKPRQVLARITRQGAKLAGAGLVIGAPAGFIVIRIIGGLPVDIPGATTGMSAVDLLPTAAVTALLAGVGLTACLLPARRATRIDPVAALREE